MNKLVKILYEVLLEDREGQLKNLFLKNNKLSEQEFKKLFDADPTQSKKFASWLMTRFYKDFKEPALIKTTKSSELVPNKPEIEKLTPEGRQKIKVFFEDLYKVTEGLERFNRISAKYPKPSIENYSIKEFLDADYDVEQKLSTFEKEKGKDKTEKYPELIIGSVDGFTVYKIPQNRPDLHPVNCDLGSNAKWCTAHSGALGTFNTYNKNDAIFNFVKGNERYQHDQYSNQWKDVRDKEMPDGKLKKDFQKFLGDVDGRIYDAEQLKDLSKYKIQTFNSEGKEYPMYKIGNKYYTIGPNNSGKEEAIYYDPDIKRFKDPRSRTLHLSFLLKHPYIDFLKAIYAQLKKEGNVKTFNNVLRLLLNLDVPPKEEGGWYKIGSEGEGIDLANSDLTELPENLWVQGNLDLEGSKITKLPKRLKVDGDLIKADGTVVN
jgi:hypothetical protein